MIYGELALKYLEAGYLTIPLRERSKRPFFDDWALSGFVTAEKVKIWAEQYPNANIGLPTGEINKILIIDIDNLDKISAIEERYSIQLDSFILPCTRTSKGIHCYFKYPEGRIIKNRVGFKGLFDVRSTGGQVVLPPSIHPDTHLPYEWVKDADGVEYSLFTITELPELPLSILADLIEENESTIVRKERIIDYITKELEPKRADLINYQDWLNCGFAIANALGERGRNYFLRLCWNGEEGKPATDGNKQFTACLKSEQRYSKTRKVTIATLIKIASQFNIHLPSDLKNTIKNVFWKIDEESGKVEYSTENLGRFLTEELCIFSYKWEEGRKFVKEKDNILIEVDAIDILREMKEYIEDAENANPQVIEYINKSVNGLFTDKFFHTILKEKKSALARDKADEIYLYFRNGYFSITKNGAIFHNYNELAWSIWESHIIDWDFHLTESYQKSDMYTFIFNVCGHDVNKVLYAMQLIGYLTHQYNDESRMRAVILVDEKSNKREANGRTGKSVFGKMFQKCGLRKVVEERGKNFNIDSQFAWQKINIDTQIIFLNDIKSEFRFEDLFNVISDGITVEKKNKQAFSIPIENTPKILISTNKILLGEGASFEGRKYELEFSNYYNQDYSPRDEFGHNLYEWKEEEQWDYFYSLIIYCCTFYLETGVIPIKSDNLIMNKIKQSTSEDFIEFILNYNFRNGLNYDKKELYEDFLNEYGEYKAISQRVFTSYCMLFFNNMKIIYSEKRTGTSRFFEFENIEQKIEELNKQEKEQKEKWERMSLHDR